MSINSTYPPNSAHFKLTGYPAGPPSAEIRGSAKQAAACFTAVKSLARLNTRATPLYLGKMTGHPPARLDEANRTGLDNSLVMTERPGQGCPRFLIHPDNQGQCIGGSGMICGHLPCPDPRTRLQVRETTMSRLSLPINLSGWLEETGVILWAEEI